jgi:glyoxylase-like metal-dependent hydrolase (beta-lactamase superfamily II)
MVYRTVTPEWEPLYRPLARERPNMVTDMHRISLSNVAFEGDNNVYLFDGERTVMVDTGDSMSGTREHLEEGLAAHGVGFEDIDEILLTHWHGDHTGLAGEIQQAGGATVRIHEADAPLVENPTEGHEGMRARQTELFEEWGMPEAQQERLLSFFESGPETVPADVTPFEDGERFAFGDLTLDVVHMPGHAAGLCAFVFDGERGREVFPGDALLPVYTPNVGGADVRVERPLEKYLEALVDVVHAGYERAWPGHRDPIDDPAARARKIIHHHEERCWRVLDALERKGPADAWTVSADLFGDLESIHILHGPGEAHAHLDHLERDGAIERTDEGYTLTDETAERLAAVESEEWPLLERDAAGEYVALL